MAVTYTLAINPAISTNPKYAGVDLSKVIFHVGRVDGAPEREVSARLNPQTYPSHLMERLMEKDTVQLAEFVRKGLVTVTKIVTAPDPSPGTTVLTPQECIHISYIDTFRINP